MSAVPTHKTVHVGRRDSLAARMLRELRRVPPSAAPLIAATGMLLYMINLREAHFRDAMQLVSGWACVLVLIVIARFDATRRNGWRIVFILVAGYLTLRYLWWRSFETLIYTNPLDFIGMSALFGAEVYSITLHILGLFVNVWPLEREEIPLPSNRARWPTVDVLIPTYSEDPEIVRLTALAATQIDYPKEKLRIYICDDGGTLAKRAHEERGEEAWKRRYRLKEIAAELGVNYLTRETNRSAKAGNLNHALVNSKGEYVLFLDCDHVPTAEILQRTLGYFLADSKVFLVQTPHFFVNAAPAETAIGGGVPVPDESEMFYRVIHPGLDTWNASYFCGSAAVMRRSHLMEVGGISGQSITEDAETAFELHRRGYHSVYVNHPMVCGLAPESYADYMLQHTRWAQGMAQIFILHDPLFVPGLSLAQRLCYFNCCLFWFFGVARVIYFLAPAAFLLFGMSIYHASAPQIVAYALPFVFSTFIVTDFLFGKMRRPFFSEIYESVQSVFLAPAVLSTVRHPHKPSFKVTPKGIGVKEEQLNSLSLVFFALLCLNLASALSGAGRFWAQPEFRDVISVTIIWSVYNVYLALVSIGALWERRQIRKHHRLQVGGTAMVQFPRMNLRVPVDLVNLSVTGMGFTAKLDFEVKERERVLIEASGAEGLVIMFEGEVRRARDRDGATYCGVQFLRAEESYADIVRFVYGDSRRWVTVWDIRSRGIPLVDLFWQLGRMGLRGAWLCGAITAKSLWRWTKRAFAGARKGLVALFAAAVALASQAETMKIPFEQLTGDQKMELRCIADQREIQIPLPERWRLKRATMHVKYTVSANLIPDTSTLVVRVRGEPVKQVRLNPQTPDSELTVDMPVALLEPGYNPASIGVSQHAKKEQCENPCTPDLWTSVSLRESYVEMEYDLRPLPRELSALSTHVFDPRLMPAGEVHIVIPDFTAPSATLAGIVASGVARRFDYRRVGFTVSRSLQPGVDNVVVGKRSFMQNVPGAASAGLANPIKGGYLKLLPMVTADGTADPAHALLLLSGEDDIATKLAAITFSNISFRFPGSDELNAFDFVLPQVSQYSGRETIAADTVYSLKTLNFPTQSWVGLNPGERSITFRLPADFHIRPNQQAKLLLNFSYGVGLKNDSSFNVSVNGRGVRAVRLDSPTGTFIENYELNIPTYVFVPGTNTITFAAHLNSGGQLCDLLNPDGLFFTLYDNSSISFPPMPHFVEMPKIELFVQSGFPMTRWPDGHEAYVWLADKDERTLAAALNIVGLATQRNGFPLFDLGFTYDKPAQGGEILAVGTSAAISHDLRASAPLKLLEDGVTVPYPVVRGWNAEASSAFSRQKSALGTGRALFMQFQSPYEAGRSVMMLTASVPEDLEEASRMLLTGPVQSQTKGDLVLIERGEKEPKVTSMSAGARYATGKEGTYSAVESFLYTRPMAYYGVIAASIAVVAFALFLVLRRWRAHRRARK